jgi:hypothetical protein
MVKVEKRMEKVFDRDVSQPFYVIGSLLDIRIYQI